VERSLKSVLIVNLFCAAILKGCNIGIGHLSVK